MRELLGAHILSNNFCLPPSSIISQTPQIESRSEANRNEFNLQFITNKDGEEENNNLTNTIRFRNETNDVIQSHLSNQSNSFSPIQPIISSQYNKPIITQPNQNLIEEIIRLQKENSSLKGQLNQKNEELEKQKKEREKNLSHIPPIFLPSQGRQAGNFNFLFKYNTNLLVTDYTPNNSILTKISEQMALFFGRLPTEVLGKPMASFVPALPQQAVRKKSLV